MVITSYTQTFAPVNKNAFPEAKQLLNYLYRLNRKIFLIGEHGDERWLDITHVEVKISGHKFMS